MINNKQTVIELPWLTMFIIVIIMGNDQTINNDYGCYDS